MINKVTLVGNVGQDPEVRVMQSGSKMASFSLATSESWKDKNGEKRNIVEWHKVVVYNDKLCEVIGSYVKKGTKLYVEGQIKSRKYSDNAGVEKTIVEIVLQNFNGTIKILSQDAYSSEKPKDSNDPDNYGMHETSHNKVETTEDDIPF